VAITIDGKQYDETKLDDKHKNAVVQVTQAQNKLRQLQGEFENCKILIEHHSKFLKDNLPATAIIEPGNSKDAPAEEATAE
jgi:hypothetical protein